MGTHPFSNVLQKSDKPMVILSEEALSHESGRYVLELAQEVSKNFSLVKDGWNGFNILHNTASRVGAIDLGIVSNSGLKGYEMTSANKIKALILLGADNLELKRTNDSPFTVYIGHHGDNGASVADVVLPGLAYTEKNSTYVNTEGRVQHTRKAVNSPGESLDDWKIVIEICKKLSVGDLPESLDEIRKKMTMINPIFNYSDIVLKNQFTGIGKDNSFMESSDFPSWRGNFFLDNVISRNSQTMLRCAKAGGWLSNINIGKE
jgi:NADH-quinone oxidoreductase subunit G